MYRFRRDGISVIAVLDTRHAKKNGLYPVKIEVIFKRQQKYFPTGMDASKEEWETMWNARRLPEKGINIEKSFYLIRNAVNELIDRGEFSFMQLERRLGYSNITVNQAIARKMDESKSNGKINTYYRYRNTMNALQGFGGRNISFDSVSVSWLKRCENFWRREGKCSTTINIYMRSLRCVMHEALAGGILKPGNFPFVPGGYRIPAAQERKMALSRRDIIAIMNWKGDEKSEYWRDMWMFSYLCNGINFRDMLFLRRSNIIDGEIVFTRSKTSTSLKRPKIIHATLLKEMAEIIEKHGNGIDGPKNVMLFKHASGNESPQETANVVRNAISSGNAVMKVIAEEIGIDHISTYTARHTYATVLMKSGVDISFISKSLGHSNIQVTEAYLGCYDKEDRAQNSQKLLLGL